jgi:dynein heavy chain
LEDINNILNSGDVNNLMAVEDYDEIFQDLKPMIKEMGIYESRDSLIKLFTQNIR